MATNGQLVAACVQAADMRVMAKNVRTVWTVLIPRKQTMGRADNSSCSIRGWLVQTPDCDGLACTTQQEMVVERGTSGSRGPK